MSPPPCLASSTTDATTLRTARVESSAVIDGIPRLSSFSYQYGDAIIHFAGLSFLGSYRVALLNLLLRHPWTTLPFKVMCHAVSLVAIPVLQTPLPRALLERAYS